MVGFVDDSNGQTNLFMQDETDATRSTILNQLQANAQLWSGLLGASGGALELSKCSYHVIAWQFTTKGAPVLVTDPSTFQRVKVTAPGTGEEQNLQYLSPYKTLPAHNENSIVN